MKPVATAAAPAAAEAYGVPLVSVVGDFFCVPYPVELIVKKKSHNLFDSKYEALDANGNLYFHVNGSSHNFEKKRVMRDAAGFPLLNMREKALSSRHRWTIYRGESSEQNNMIFSVRRSSSSQLTKFRHKVFLPNNLNEDVPNFQIVESNSPSWSYKVYKGETLIAEFKFVFSWENIAKGTKKLALKIYPGVDYAFIVALVVILYENDITCI
ncbi:protein LURP-one-related 14-like [Cannabis sativa]|uniref:protein LURP-one-related 14-like n=1 Tax=Cannabis sativa TaxID=3483 RepID=UPI0029CA0C06|nr:protein LURP-one-related 14-like [Cannabis sativa]